MGGSEWRNSAVTNRRRCIKTPRSGAERGGEARDEGGEAPPGVGGDGVGGGGTTPSLPSPASVFAVINLPRESWQHRDINHGGASR